MLLVSLLPLMSCICSATPASGATRLTDEGATGPEAVRIEPAVATLPALLAPARFRYLRTMLSARRRRIGARDDEENA